MWHGLQRASWFASGQHYITRADSASRQCEQPFQACWRLQGEDADDAAVDTLMWASPASILVCLTPASDGETVWAAMITWQEWDAANPKTYPEELSVQKAGFWTISDATPHQKPSMRGLLLPQWNLVLAVHRNASEDPVKLFGEQVPKSQFSSQCV